MPSREVLKEVVGCTLVKLLLRVLHHPEDDGLWDGEDQGDHPGQDHLTPDVWLHNSLLLTCSSPCSLSLSDCIQGEQWPAYANRPT